ncbi:uncharacterized protein [Hoplias malabaricus]|uniref:uncharacterized protein n=1 Tax=Hoplias malabaricus TaxID=27720 RepID=UPI003462DF63
MNLPQNPDMFSPFQSDDEAVLLEAAVRSAVMSIMKVFLEVNETRAKSYQLKLSQMEKENIQLRLKLKAAERQLCLSSSRDSYEISADLTFSPESNQSSSTEMDEEEDTGAVGSSQNLSEREACLEVSESKPFKEEPAYEDTFWIKNEMHKDSEPVDFEYQYHVLAHVGRTVSGQHQQEAMSVQRFGPFSTFHPPLQEDNIVVTSEERRKLKSSERVKRYRERIRADPERYLILKEKERLRYLRRRKTIADLSEPMKNLKRKAWREAARRHRARKQAQMALT